MEIREIIELVLVALCGAGFGIMLFYKVRGNLLAAVSELIALAETTDLAGSEKMKQVVTALYGMVPAPFRSILTASRLEKIAQYVFDWMRKYADEYRAKLESIPPSDQNIDKTVSKIDIELKAELIAELLTLTLVGLKDKALEYGVNIEGLTTKKDLIEGIVKAVLTRA